MVNLAQKIAASSLAPIHKLTSLGKIKQKSLKTKPLYIKHGREILCGYSN